VCIVEIFRILLAGIASLIGSRMGQKLKFSNDLDMRFDGIDVVTLDNGDMTLQSSTLTKLQLESLKGCAIVK